MRRILLALAFIGLISPATAQNYNATAGSGLTFGAKSVTSVLYPQTLMCDPTTPANCVAVNASGQITLANTSFAVTNAGTFVVQLSGATNNINNIAGTISLPTGASTSVLQTTGNTSLASIVSAATTPLNNSSVPINVSTATTTQLVALSGSTVIYVTSFDVIAGGTGNITFEYGTGSNCGTGTTILTGAYNLTAQAGIAKGSGIGTVLKVPAGNALCVLTSAGVQMSGSVSYQQF